MQSPTSQPARDTRINPTSRQPGPTSREPGKDTLAVSTSQQRRMSGPLDESGAPLPEASGAKPMRSLDEQIRIRAYERFIARQGKPGCAESDWLEAEREVRLPSARMPLKPSGSHR